MALQDDNSIQQTVACAICGPSGAGKSVLDRVFTVTSRVEPHRVRRSPRNEKDTYYLSEEAYQGIRRILADRGGPIATVPCEDEEPIMIYHDVALFSVRRAKQILFLPREASPTRKLEIFGPVFHNLLRVAPSCAPLRTLFAEQIFIIMLNPWDRPFSDVNPAAAANVKTPEGGIIYSWLRGRGDTEQEIVARMRGIGAELRAWQSLQALADEPRVRILEVLRWSWPEYCFTEENTNSLLKAAVAAIHDVAHSSLPSDRMKAFLGLFERGAKPASSV